MTALEGYGEIVFCTQLLPFVSLGILADIQTQSNTIDNELCNFSLSGSQVSAQA